MIHNTDRVSNICWKLCVIGSLASCAAMLVPNQKIQKAGFIGALTGVSAESAVCLAAAHAAEKERRRQNQKIFDNFMKQQGLGN